MNESSGDLAALRTRTDSLLLRDSRRLPPAAHRGETLLSVVAIERGAAEGCEAVAHRIVGAALCGAAALRRVQHFVNVVVIHRRGIRI